MLVDLELSGIIKSSVKYSLILTRELNLELY